MKKRDLKHKEKMNKKSKKTKFADSEDEEKEDSDMFEEEEVDEEVESSGDENVHGFVYSHNLDTYRKSKREKLEIQLGEREQNKQDHKDKFKKNHNKKKGGDTNKKKLKHKPFSMVKQKKLRT